MGTKHIKMFEEFDLERFMASPEEYFHDDESPTIEEGDYVTSYRGTGQVLKLDPIFAQVQLFDGPKSLVKIPVENLTKIKKEEAVDFMKKTVDSRKDLKAILDQVQQYLESVETTSEEEEEKISGNLESTVDYLEEILVDILSLKRKDPYTTQYQDFYSLISLIASISHLAISQTEDRNLLKRITAVLDKFYEISE